MQVPIEDVHSTSCESANRAFSQTHDVIEMIEYVHAYLFFIFVLIQRMVANLKWVRQILDNTI